MGAAFDPERRGGFGRDDVALGFGLIFVLVGIIAEQVAQLRRAQSTED